MTTLRAFVSGSLPLPALPQQSVVLVGNDPYYVRPRVEAILPLSVPAPSAPGLVPATVINLRGEPISLSIIQQSIRTFLNEDDVFQDGFVKGGYLVVSPGGQVFQQHQHPLYQQTDPKPLSCVEDTPLSDEVATYLDDHNLWLCFVAGDSFLPTGPYIVADHKLHQAWRLFPDHLEAFSSTLVPDDTETFDADNPRYTRLQSSPFSSFSSFVAVPSRLYYHKTPELPLHGVRISVKDNIHLNGVETTVGNKAYTQLYGKQTATADFLLDLIRKGAVVVGKTKLSAFAGSETPPDKCIDYFPPWNPRGDGYQSPSGSSSGSGATVSGYSWIDYALCTDTTGSGRFPAAAHGVWGLRTTRNAVSLNGVVRNNPTMDAICVLFRSPRDISTLVKSLGLPDSSEDDLPTRIVYPTDWYPIESEVLQGMTEKFIAGLEDFLGIKRTPVSLADEWTRSAPEDVREEPLAEYLKGTAGPANEWEIYHAFDDFRSEYQAKFGKTPYVSPAHTKRWDYGKTVTQETRDAAFHKCQRYAKWFEEEILQVDQGGKSKTIVVMPLGRATPYYRDLTEHDGQAPTRIPPEGPIASVSMTGDALVVVPIGQIPYQSRISGLEEYLPVVTTLVGAKGHDQMLLRVAYRALETARIDSEVLTGKQMFGTVQHEDAGLSPPVSSNL